MDTFKMSPTSVREEIDKLVKSHLYVDDTQEWVTEEILKLIEKSIDTLYPANPIDTEYKTGYYNAICKVKEILKNES